MEQDPALPRPHLGVGSGGEGLSLEIPVCLRPSEGKQLLPLFLCLQLPHLSIFLLAAA